MEDFKKEMIEGFSALSTANISDACDELGLPRRVFVSPRRIDKLNGSCAGFAVTIQQRERRRDAEKGKNLTRHAATLDKCVTPGDIVVIDTLGYKKASTIGAMLTYMGKLRGASGFVINGAARDIEDIVRLDIPFACTDISPLKSSLDLETVGVNVPVRIDDVDIVPGDLIVIDKSGALAIAEEHLETVLKKAQAIAAYEKRYMKLLSAGCSLDDTRKLAAAGG